MNPDQTTIRDYMKSPEIITTKLQELISADLVKQKGLCSLLQISRATLQYKLKNSSWKLNDTSILLNSGILNIKLNND